MMDPEPLDPRYVQARRVLLDALFALAPYGAAIIVAGAQAIYLHTGDADFAIAPFTIQPVPARRQSSTRSRDARRGV